MTQQVLPNRNENLYLQKDLYKPQMERTDKQIISNKSREC